jgi:hypothetical protein
MKPEHRIILDAFCQWLNHVWKANMDGEEGPYRVENFSNSPVYGYGHHEEIQRNTDGWYTHITLEISDGDEGGPTILNVWLRGDGVEEQGDPYTVEYGTNEFDTMIGMWCHDGKLVNTKGYSNDFNGTEAIS